MAYRFCSNHPLLTLLLCGLVFFGSGAGSLAEGQDQAKPGVFFSQGQAVYSAQDRSRSQNAAIESFLTQAISQAVATFLSPSQMGGQFPLLQEKILSQPKRYVQEYKVFSEGPEAAGLYRVTGQVTVAMDILKRDLLQHGLALRSATPGSSAPIPYPAPKKAFDDATPADPEKPKEVRSDKSGSRRDILWAVAERWDQQWHLPESNRDPRAVFAANILQESPDFGWSLRLPRLGSVSVDQNGQVSEEQVAAQAKGMGIREAILGTIVSQQDAQKGIRLETTLRVLNVSSGKSQGEIHRQWSKEDASAQEGAMEMASMVVPQLDRLLREPSTAAPVKRNSSGVQASGEWTVRLRSDRLYADWEKLEKILRDHFKSMQVKSVEFGPEEGVVRLDGVDGSYFATLNGSKLREHVQIQVNEDSSQDRTISVTVVHAEIPQSDVRQ